MTRVLVTGGDGQLGQCLKHASTRFSEIEFFFEDINTLDITSYSSLERYFSAQSPFDFCVNCAAYTNVDKAESDKETAFKVNADGPKYLAQLCKNFNITLIHVSTDFVFDGKQTSPYKETDTPNPLGVYGASKLQGERYIQDLMDAYLIVRTSWLYSEYGNNFMKTMLRLSETREEISVVSDQFGSPTYAGDLAEAILKIIADKMIHYGIYHYSNEGVVSWYDFATAIFDESKKDIKVFPIKTESYPTPAKRPGYSVLDKLKIVESLGVEIPFWSDSLKQCLIKTHKFNF